MRERFLGSGKKPKVFFILVDEYSMVSAKLNVFMNYRCKELFVGENGCVDARHELDYAGFCFIAMGDNVQIPPIGNSPLYKLYVKIVVDKEIEPGKDDIDISCSEVSVSSK
jgi:hypothetical protein